MAERLLPLATPVNSTVSWHTCWSCPTCCTRIGQFASTCRGKSAQLVALLVRYSAQLNLVTVELRPIILHVANIATRWAVYTEKNEPTPCSPEAASTTTTAILRTVHPKFWWEDHRIVVGWIFVPAFLVGVSLGCYVIRGLREVDGLQRGFGSGVYIRYFSRLPLDVMYRTHIRLLVVFSIPPWCFSIFYAYYEKRSPLALLALLAQFMLQLYTLFSLETPIVEQSWVDEEGGIGLYDFDRGRLLEIFTQTVRRFREEDLQVSLFEASVIRPNMSDAARESHMTRLRRVVSDGKADEFLSMVLEKEATETNVGAHPGLLDEINTASWKEALKVLALVVYIFLVMCAFA